MLRLLTLNAICSHVNGSCEKKVNILKQQKNRLQYTLRQYLLPIALISVLMIEWHVIWNLDWKSIENDRNKLNYICGLTRFMEMTKLKKFEVLWTWTGDGTKTLIFICLLAFNFCLHRWNYLIGPIFDVTIASLFISRESNFLFAIQRFHSQTMHIFNQINRTNKKEIDKLIELIENYYHFWW